MSVREYLRNLWEELDGYSVEQSDASFIRMAENRFRCRGPEQIRDYVDQRKADGLKHIIKMVWGRFSGNDYFINYTAAQNILEEKQARMNQHSQGSPLEIESFVGD